MPVVAVIGAGDGIDRSIVALNFALAIAGDDAKVLLIDADRETGTLSRRLNRYNNEPGPDGWLSIGSATTREVLTSQRHLHSAGDQGGQGNRVDPDGDRAGTRRRQLMRSRSSTDRRCPGACPTASCSTLRMH